MANYTVNNNRYRSIALMLCCDDTERYWGELDKAEKMRESCEAFDRVAGSFLGGCRTA